MSWTHLYPSNEELKIAAAEEVPNKWLKQNSSRFKALIKNMRAKATHTRDRLVVVAKKCKTAAAFHTEGCRFTDWKENIDVAAV
jgi:hypothetical protein